MREDKIRLLEMLQGIIKRMASNSFLLKGWAVTLTAGIFALSAKDANTVFFLIAYIPIILFWFLDSYYLQLERKYRVLYRQVIEADYEPDFNLNLPNNKKSDKTSYLQCLLSLTEFGFYFSTAISVALVTVLSSMAF